MKTKKLIRSEKGDAIILLAILVTGIVALICVIAVENLKKSFEIQNIQKASLDSLYKAEEGIEYSLYANKEKTAGIDNQEPFAISVWENNDKKGGDNAIQKLIEPTEGRNVIVISESSNNQNSSQDLRRTVFANLPSKYYNQVTLWNSNEDCSSDSECISSRENNDMESGQTYQVVLDSADFQKEDWNKDNIEYRFIFNCGDSQFSKNGVGTVKGCEIKDLKVGLGCDFSQCPVGACSSFMGIDFSGGGSEAYGNTILSDWFKYIDANESTLDLRNNKLVVQFKLVNGTMEETSGPSQDLKMCKEKNDGTWQMFNDRRGGLASMEIRKETLAKQYHCCGYEQICSRYNQICTQYEQVCANSESYCCNNQSYCCGENNLGCYGGCTQYCDQCLQYCTRCTQWANGNCQNWVNGANCLEWRNGKCNHWCKD